MIGTNGEGPLPDNNDLASSGIAGLDEILHGGFTRNRLYLVSGAAGAGKTTLGMQFAIEGARAGEAREPAKEGEALTSRQREVL